MTEARNKGWWYRATKEQKLAQIDAAIELGMTAKQVAMNCGCVWVDWEFGDAGKTVAVFANRHGRNFDGKWGAHGRKRHDETTRLIHLRRIHGHSITSDAFDIFGHQNSEEPFLDEVV